MTPASSDDTKTAVPSTKRLQESSAKSSSDFVTWLFAQNCEFKAGAASIPHIPPAGALPECAIVGRSNVGKSSLLNALVNRRQLARVSHTPGRTQQINFFELGHKIMLVDLPGYGYAKVSKKQVANWGEMIGWYLENRSTLVRVIVLVDARHPLKQSDQAIMKYLNHLALPFQIVLTKVDKGIDPELKESLGHCQKIYKHAHPHILETSSSQKTGLDEVRQSIAELVHI